MWFLFQVFHPTKKTRQMMKGERKRDRICIIYVLGLYICDDELPGDANGKEEDDDSFFGREDDTGGDDDVDEGYDSRAFTCVVKENGS
jgi:hypothetical protein